MSKSERKLREQRTKTANEDERLREKEEYRQLAKKTFEITEEELQEYINKRKKEIANEIKEFANKHEIQRVSYGKLYEIMSSGNQYNRTKYSAQELWFAFEVYKSIVSDLQVKNPKHAPTKQNFCAFVGISTGTYDSYREKDDDPELVEVVNRIDDYLTDVQLTMAQDGLLNSTVTIFRTKTEHNYVEAKEYVAVNTQVNIDPTDIKQRLASVKNKTSIENK